MIFTVDNTTEQTETETPFQLAFMKFGQEEVAKVVMDQIIKHYHRTIPIPTVATIAAAPIYDDDNDDDPATCTTNTTGIITTTTITESFLLLLTVTDETIHLDELNMLLRKDPNDTLLRLQPKFSKRKKRREEKRNKTVVMVVMITMTMIMVVVVVVIIFLIIIILSVTFFKYSNK